MAPNDNVEGRAGEGQHGPSWWDCAQLIAEMREGRFRGLEVLLVPPAPKLDGTGWTSWGVLARYPKKGSPLESYHHAREAFGRGGTWKTSTAAIHRALSQLVADADSREAAAKQAAMF